MLKIDHEAGARGRPEKATKQSGGRAAQIGKPRGLHQGSGGTNDTLKEEPAGLANALDTDESGVTPPEYSAS